MEQYNEEMRLAADAPLPDEDGDDL